MQETQTTLDGIEPAQDESEAAPIVGEIAEGIRTVQGSVVEFDKISAGIAAIDAAHPSNAVVDVTTPAGMRMAIAGRAAWRNPRIALGKARKAAKAPVLELGRKIDAFASMIEAKLLVGEDHYDELIKAEEARRDAERVERQRAEEARVARHRDNIDDITGIAAPVFGLSSAEIQEKLDLVTRLEIGADYEEFQAAAVNAKATAIVRLNELLAVAKRTEAERAEAQRNKERLQQLELEAAERARRDADENEARVAREADQSLHATELAGQIRAIERRAFSASAESLAALIALLEGVRVPDDLGKFIDIPTEAKAAALENLRSRRSEAIKRDAERQTRQALYELQRYRTRAEQASDVDEVQQLSDLISTLAIDEATYGDLAETARGLRDAVLASLAARTLALQSPPAAESIDTALAVTAEPGSEDAAAADEHEPDTIEAQLASCRSALAEALALLEGFVQTAFPQAVVAEYLAQVATWRQRGGITDVP